MRSSRETKEQTTSGTFKVERVEMSCGRESSSGSFDSALRATLRPRTNNGRGVSEAGHGAPAN
jgi:hypothetical protein